MVPCPLRTQGGATLWLPDGGRRVEMCLHPQAGLAYPSDPSHPQVSQGPPARREGELWRIQAQAGLSVVAIMAVDIFFHFFYILTIPSDLKFTSRLPDGALGGWAPGPGEALGRAAVPGLALGPHGVPAGEADTPRRHSTYPGVRGRAFIP